MTTTREQYAEVLAAHDQYRFLADVGWRCACGDEFSPDYTLPAHEAKQTHRLHVADALAAALPDPEQAGTHPLYIHPTGERCIWDGDTWFVPLDAGGEGYACPLWHPTDRSWPEPVTTPFTYSDAIGAEQAESRAEMARRRAARADMQGNRKGSQVEPVMSVTAPLPETSTPQADPEQAVREARAAAWDEGYKVGEPYGYAPNPYREARP